MWRSQLSIRPSGCDVHRRAHAAAAVVAAHDDVLHLQHVDRVLEDRQAVDVGVLDDVRRRCGARTARRASAR